MHELLARWISAHVMVLLAPVAGALLGGLFYGGLWWTVRHAAEFRRPGPCMLASLLLRMGGALAGLFVVAAGDWRRLLLCLSGFVLARAAVTRLTRLPACAAPAPPARFRHAP